MNQIQKFMRVCLAAALVSVSTDGVFAYRNDDRPYVFNLPSQINPEIPDYNRRVDLNLKSYAQPPAMNFRAFLAPDLNINSYSMRLPAIEVRDIGNSVWSYEKESYHFNADLKQFDSYQAQIHFNLDGTEAPNAIAYEVGRMQFEPGKATPVSYRRRYQDQSGNLLRVDRSNQKSEINPSYNSFIQFFERENRSWGYTSERNSKASRPIEPTRELVQEFEESWELAGRDEAGGKINSSVIVRLDDIKHETNLHRFISSYSGSVQEGKTTLQFAVVSPHDDKGTVKSLDFEIKAPGTPIAKISWKPVAGANGDEAFKLLRDNLPVPVLLGPRGSFRLNGVDLAEAPLKITSDGNISPKQLGDAKDLSNLIGKENFGIKVSFSPPAADSSKSRFSLMSGLRNLGYMLTGRWSEVKSMRQELGAMQKQEPGKFVLAAGFSDPSFMGIKDLRGALDRSKTIRVPTSESKTIVAENAWDRLDPAIRARFDQSVARLDRADLRMQNFQIATDKLKNLSNVIKSEIKRDDSRPTIEIALAEIEAPIEKFHELTQMKNHLAEKRLGIEDVVQSFNLEEVNKATIDFENEVKSFDASFRRAETEVAGKVSVARFFLREFASMNLRAEPTEETGTRLLLGLNQFRREGKLSGQSFHSLAGAVAAEVVSQGIKEAGLIKSERLIAIDQSLRSAPESMAEGAVKGDFIKEPNLWNIGGQVGASFTPAGVATDIRDLGAAFNKLAVSRGRAGKLDVSLAFVAFVPVIGDGVKGLYKGLKLPNGIIESLAGTGKIGRTAVRFAGHGDDIARAAKAFENSSPAIRDAVKVFLTPGARRTEAEIIQLVKNSVPPPKVLARIVVTDSTIVHGTLSKSRPTIFTFAVDDIAGLSKTEILKKTGWPLDNVRKAEKTEISIALVEVDLKKFIVEVPSWNAVEKTAISDGKFLKAVSGSGLDENKLPHYFELVKGKGATTVESKTFRKLLEEQYGINPLFSGEGLTRSYDGSVGVREYWIKPVGAMNNSDWVGRDFMNSVLLTPWK